MNYISNGKVVIIHLIVRLVKKILLYIKKSYYSPNNHSKNKIEVELDLSNHARKSDLKKATGADTSEFAKKTHLATLKLEVEKLEIHKLEKVPSDLSNLKSKIDELDIGKLKTSPIDLNKLSNVLKNEVVKKIVFDELVKKLLLLILMNLLKKQNIMQR